MLTASPAVPAPAKPLSDSWLTAQLLGIRLCVSPRTVWRFVSTGQLPQPIKLSHKVTRWRWADVVGHLERRQQEDADAAVHAEVDAALAELARGAAAG